MNDTLPTSMQERMERSGFTRYALTSYFCKLRPGTRCWIRRDVSCHQWFRVYALDGKTLLADVSETELNQHFKEA